MLFVLTFLSLAYAAQKNRIELIDGGIFEGEVISLREGEYTIKSTSIGTFKVEASRVRKISPVGPTEGFSGKPALPADTAAGGASEVQKVQSMIAADPDMMKALPGLTGNADFQALLKDPEIMKAAKSMDLKTLMTNEKVVNAANNPAIQEISRKIKKKNG